MSANLQKALAAQGLDETDLAANRAGRVSEKQLARQGEARRGGFVTVWLVAVLLAGSGVAVGLWDFLGTGRTGLLIFMTLFGLGMAAFPLGIYYAFRFADRRRSRRALSPGLRTPRWACS